MRHTITEYLNELVEITERIVELDLEDEAANDAKLLDLQSQQHAIQSAINTIREEDSSFAYSNHEIECLEKCKQLEMRIFQKLTDAQRAISIQMNEISAGRRSHNLYNADGFHQTGYFIDRQR